MAREEKADWMEHLPMVLLGVRTAWRSELEASPAELTFGTALHLPGEFVDATDISFSDHDFLRNLKKQMNELSPVQTSDHATRRQGRVPKSIANTTHVFVRRDAKNPPLTRPYTGPFRVLSRSEKYFELDLNGKKDKVSIDRLKPAYLEDSAIICYGPALNKNKDARATEISPSETAKPLESKVKRGRPSRAVLEERRRLADIEQERERETDRKDDHQKALTRFGRVTRPPDRF